MRRLALLLAASVLGTGCIVTSDGTDSGTGTVVVRWSFQRTAPAVQGGALFYDDITDASYDPGPGPGCQQSLVDFIRIVRPNGVVDEIDCVFGGDQAAAYDLIAAGSRTFRLTGYRNMQVGPPVAVYDAFQTVNVQAGGTVETFVDLVGVPGALDLFAYFAPAADPTNFYLSCAEATNPEVDVHIRDRFGIVIDEILATPCANPIDPEGIARLDLDLDTYEIRMQGYNGANALIFDSCWRPLDHFSDQLETAGFAPTLVTPPQSCPN